VSQACLCGRVRLSIRGDGACSDMMMPHISDKTMEALNVLSNTWNRVTRQTRGGREYGDV
jgi:hypothetical protein